MAKLFLGKLPPKHNDRTLSLQAYLKPKAKLPAKPNKLWREFKVPEWGMYGNDVMGDCTVAAKAHTIMLMTAHTGKMVTPDPAAVMQAYIDLTGYDPATGANDTGCAMTDVLQYWQQKGIAGHKIIGWAQIDHTNIEQVKLAMYLFGVVDIGVQFPNSAMQQFNSGKAWRVLPDDGGIAGGHDVPLFGYGAAGASCVTWAKRQEMVWGWFKAYCDEAYCPISPDWIDKATSEAPNMLDMSALTADLKVLAA
jgi:hypothetical protein